MADKQWSRYADVKRITGKYTKDGKERNRYHTIGTIVATPHLSQQFLVLDSLPNAGEKLAIFIKEDWQGYRPDDKPEDEKLLAEDYANKQRVKDTISDVPF